MSREELFDRHLRGELTEGEAAELKRLLATDADAGRAFVEHVGETTLLVRVGSQLKSAEVPTNVVSLESSSSEAGRVGVRSSRRWQVFALAACLLALGVVAVLINQRQKPAGPPPIAQQPQVTPEILVTGEDVQVTRDGKRLDPSRVELQPGDVVTASSNAAAAIAYRREATRLELQPGAVMVFGETREGNAREGKRFELLQGIVFARVAAQPPATPLRIKTTHARATVLGTEFLIRADTEGTRLDVLEGKVQLNCRVSGKKVVVKGGMGATVHAGKASFDMTPLCKSNCILRECRSADAAAKFEKLKSNDEK